MVGLTIAVAIRERMPCPMASSTQRRSMYARTPSWFALIVGWLKCSIQLILDATVEALCATAADQHKPGLTQRKAALDTIADCDKRLSTYRTVLEAGGDAAVVATWTAEVVAQRALARQKLAKLDAQRVMPIDKDHIEQLVRSFGDLLAVLDQAPPEDKAEIYAQLQLNLVYHPARKIVEVEARPAERVYESQCRRGDVDRMYTGTLGGELVLD